MVEVKPPKIITEMSITARPIHILAVAITCTMELKLLPWDFNLLDI